MTVLFAKDSREKKGQSVMILYAYTHSNMYLLVVDFTLKHIGMGLWKVINGREPGGHLLQAGFSRRQTLRWVLEWRVFIGKCYGYQQLWKRRKENRIGIEQREKSPCDSASMEHLSQPYGTFWRQCDTQICPELKQESQAFILPWINESLDVGRSFQEGSTAFFSWGNSQRWPGAENCFLSSRSWENKSLIFEGREIWVALCSTHQIIQFTTLVF